VYKSPGSGINWKDVLLRTKLEHALNSVLTVKLFMGEGREAEANIDTGRLPGTVGKVQGMHKAQ